MAEPEPTSIDCAIHGRSMGAVVCCHMLGTTDRVLGFVENSDDPTDLQAWCGDCESLFLQEQGMTEAFREFNDFAVVCVDCYAALKRRHSSAGFVPQRI